MKTNPRRLRHDEIKRKLERKLNHALNETDGWSVDTEVTHKSNLPSNKSRCRTDVELEFLEHNIAFEVKMSVSDAKNWYTQRIDYDYLGMTPTLVTTLNTAVKLAPHQYRTLGENHIIIDTKDGGWYWKNDVPVPYKYIQLEFESAQAFEFVDQCPECGCWTDSAKSAWSIYCANCDWRVAVDDLKS
jgi:hypothetical protein